MDDDFQSDGVDLIARERKRQVREKGFTANHDDENCANGELGRAAACYAFPAPVFGMISIQPNGCGFVDPWPWKEGDKRAGKRDLLNLPPEERIDLLKRAGAMCAAEIDRLLRLRRRTH